MWAAATNRVGRIAPRASCRKKARRSSKLERMYVHYTFQKLEQARKFW